MYSAQAEEFCRQTKLMLACPFSGKHTVFRAEHKCHNSHEVYPLECAAHTPFLHTYTFRKNCPGSCEPKKTFIHINCS